MLDAVYGAEHHVFIVGGGDLEDGSAHLLEIEKLLGEFIILASLLAKLSGAVIDQSYDRDPAQQHRAAGYGEVSVGAHSSMIPRVTITAELVMHSVKNSFPAGGLVPYTEQRFRRKPSTCD
jgi:hypothetical protein